MLKKLYTRISKKKVKGERIYNNLDDLRSDQITMISQYIGNY